MMIDVLSAPWEQPGWLEAVNEWTHAALARHGLRATGAFEQLHARPWSAVVRVPATTGDVYFKAVLPRLAHEIALTVALAEWRPDCMLPVLAADAARGWLLTPDGGTTLRHEIRTSRDYRHWEQVLPLYAEVQIALAGRVPDMLAFGVPDRRLAALPALYARVLADRALLRIDQERGLSAAEYQRLQALAPALPALCAELASYGIPETLNHGDFGDANVLLRAGRPLFFDWGDAALTHPFYSLRTTFVSLYYSLQIDDMAPDTPEIKHLRDVYLEPWTVYAAPERLRAAFTLARRLAAINGALAWYETLVLADDAGRAAYGHTVPSLLQEFLELGQG